MSIKGQVRLIHAWDIPGGASTDLWSMPSSHTFFAALFSAFLASLYPRLRWLMVALTVLVAIGRVVFAAHWPTDVIVGASLGCLIGAAATRNYWGVRAVDWLWRVLVDRGAEPALAGVLAAERARIADGLERV